MGIYTTELDVHEKAYSQREDHDIDTGTIATVVLERPWAQRHAVVNDILGNGYTWPNGSFANVIARKATITPSNNGRYVENAGGGGAVYDTAQILLTYSSPSTNVDESTSGDLYSETLEPYVEALRLNPERFRWGASTGDLVHKEEAPSKQFYGVNIVRTIYNAVSLPGEVFTSIGGVNDFAYTSLTLGQTFDAETLLYQPPFLSRTIKIDGSREWTVTMKFCYKPEGWNRFWRAGVSPADWYEFFDVQAGAVYKNYPLVSMSALLF